MVMSMRCILSSASVPDSILLLAAIPKKARWKVEGDTFDNIWNALVWSFTAMFTGKWPIAHSWDGSRILSGRGHDLAGLDLDHVNHVERKQPTQASCEEDSWGDL